MQLEVGKIYEGKVKNITQYGAFIDIEGGGTGMVHISEISDSFVHEIRDHLTENQVVKVKVIGINDAGKASLSIKKAKDATAANRQRKRQPDGNIRKDAREPKKKQPEGELSFEDMLTRFKQTSEERMCDIKRSNDRKNGARRK